MVDGTNDKDRVGEPEEGVLNPQEPKDTAGAVKAESGSDAPVAAAGPEAERGPTDEAAASSEASSEASSDASSDTSSDTSFGASRADDVARPADAANAASTREPVTAPKSARQAIEPETPPSPPTRSKAVRHPVIVFANFIFTVLLLLVVGAGGLLYFGKRTFTDEGPLKTDKTLVVSKGTGLGTIASILERQNVISNRHIFEYGVRIYQKENQLKAGEYLFRPGLSMNKVMDILTSGKSILHAVTIPEGYTSYQAYQVIKANTILVGDAGDIPPEGSLLPETYKFSRGTTRAELIKRMQGARNRAVDEIWARRANDLPFENKEQMVTLASIVEKETGQASERTRVAGVFINRLNQGIKLQSDPTVIYGIFGGKGKPKGRPIFRSDLDKKTGYNTYHIDGLTPGPIANPGKAALEAVANPSRTNDLFFVADGTGGHVFAETLKQHQINVKRWREVERQRIEAMKKKAQEQEKEAQKAQKGSDGEAPAGNGTDGNGASNGEASEAAQ